MATITGLDLSFSEPSQQWWKDRYAEGYRVMVQDLWTGGDLSSVGLIGVAERNISRARAAGFIVCGYTNVAPWNNGDAAFNGAKKIAGAEWGSLEAVFVDVEIKAWNGQSIREADIKRCLELIRAERKKTAVYSANWFWTGHLGNPQWPWLRNYMLWNAYYDEQPDFDFASAPYGPWTVADVMGEQYTGTKYIAGIAIDKNAFLRGFFIPPTPTQEDNMPDEATFKRWVREAVTEMRLPLADESNPPKAVTGSRTLAQWLRIIIKDNLTAIRQNVRGGEITGIWVREEGNDAIFLVRWTVIGDEVVLVRHHAVNPETYSAFSGDWHGGAIIWPDGTLDQLTVLGPPLPDIRAVTPEEDPA